LATPIVYPVSLVPGPWRLIYSLNPMVAVVEGFRWGLVGGTAPAAEVVAASVGVTAALLIGGLLVFDRFTRNFADRL
jgi:lipopolysaccharide transport system permease protein